METSTTTKELTLALCQFQAGQIKATKSHTNPAFKTKYAGINEVLDAVLSSLTECGLCFVQFPEGENGLTTRLMHISGEWMQASYTMRPAQATPQGVGSAMTYARRYALLSVLGLGTEDDDGHAASQPAPAAKVFPLAAESERLIKQLLKHPVITLDEQGRVLQGLSKLNHETGKKTIDALQKWIATRPLPE